MSDQYHKALAPVLERPTTSDPNEWKTYWEILGWPWRTEPEINKERQNYLAERRAIVPNIKKGLYPFQGLKLNRADIEWLLVKHESGGREGAIDWSDEHQRTRKGLDLRGAILSSIDLSYLPLARTCGGLTVREWDAQESNQRDLARIHLEKAFLFKTHLEGVDLNGAYMEGADLSYAFMELSYLVEAHLEGARLHKGHFEHAYFREAHLEGTYLTQAYLHETDLSLAHLEGKHMMASDLERIQMWDKNFPALLPPAKLNGSFFDNGTKLKDAIWGNEEFGFVWLADLSWGNVNLTLINWSNLTMVGEEYEACQRIYDNKAKDKFIRDREYREAVRVNRQLAVVLRSQGLNEEADRFAYQAQIMRRRELRLQLELPHISIYRKGVKLGDYLFSLFFDLLAGYGYHPSSSVIWYLITIFGFALAYFTVGHLPFWPDAFVYSLTSFHGRGFLPNLDGQVVTLHYPLVVMAAFEAVVGLLIEISFIATFTQRFFGR